MTKYVLALFMAFALAVAVESTAMAIHPDRVALRHAQTMPWHGSYYNTARGAPISLVVPPTAHMQVNWGWGVSQSTMTPIYHQYYHHVPGDIGSSGYPFQATPQRPSNTNQFGVYYVRAPY
ncbi:MAG: hypothetical protein ACC628_15045 [Pirellulaceae bacterium]